MVAGLNVTRIVASAEVAVADPPGASSNAADVADYCTAELHNKSTTRAKDTQDAGVDRVGAIAIAILQGRHGFSLNIGDHADMNKIDRSAHIAARLGEQLPLVFVSVNKQARRRVDDYDFLLRCPSRNQGNC